MRWMNRSGHISRCLLSFLLTALSLTAVENNNDRPINDSLIKIALEPREFVFLEGFALSPDGKLIAYSVRQKPTEVDLNQRYSSKHTPTYSMGSRLYISDRNGRTKQVEGKGSSWRPVWSPDSSQLAFLP